MEIYRFTVGLHYCLKPLNSSTLKEAGGIILFHSAMPQISLPCFTSLINRPFSAWILKHFKLKLVALCPVPIFIFHGSTPKGRETCTSKSPIYFESSFNHLAMVKWVKHIQKLGKKNNYVCLPSIPGLPNLGCIYPGGTFGLKRIIAAVKYRVFNLHSGSQAIHIDFFQYLV